MKFLSEEEIENYISKELPLPKEPKQIIKCFECFGYKWVIHPDAKPDVVEGHKFSRRIPCNICSDEERFKATLNLENKNRQKKFQQEIRKIEKDRKKLEEVLKRTPKKDLQILGII